VPETEQQAYEVIESLPDFELRRYPSHLVAETEVEGAFERAGNAAFPRLARYIGGHNQSSRKMSMTAPVVQMQDPHGGGHVVGFVMPAGIGDEDLPGPVDSTVHTRRVPVETAAALRFSGRWSSSACEKRTEQLLVAVAAAGLEVVGAPRYALRPALDPVVPAEARSRRSGGRPTGPRGRARS
jgi:hypothetical protein